MVEGENAGMGKVIGIHEHTPHIIRELICLKCHDRFISVAHCEMLLRNAECTCGGVGFLIDTGEIITEDDGFIQVDE